MIITVYNYIGALIGAGFASGQEILTFFVRYGRAGFIGIILASAIFGFFAFHICSLALRYGCFDYRQLLEKTASPLFKLVTAAVTVLFAAGVYVAMMTCFGELCRSVFGLSKLLCSALMCTFCGIILLMKGNSIMRFNAVLGILTVACTMLSLFYMLAYREQQTFSNTAPALIESGAYAGYNLLGTGVILCRGARKMKTRTDAILTGFAAAVTMLLMMTGVYVLLSMYSNRIPLSDIPLLTMAMRYPSWVTVLYCAALIGALITTALADGLTVMDLTKNFIGKRSLAAILFIISIVGSNASFGVLINSVYRALGYAGMALTSIFVISTLLLSNSQKKSETKRKSKIIAQKSRKPT